MSRRWIVSIACAAIVVSESFFALSSPAHADGAEALMQRLLETPPAEAAAKQASQPSSQAQPAAQPGTQATATAPAPANAARTTPREALRLTPDRTEIVRLEKDAASVVVTNPVHAQVMMETPRLLLVMPRTPGSTSLFVLDKDGATILEREIIVSGASKPYVRIRKSCNGDDRACIADSYFYCPDGCYQVAPVAPDDTITPPPVAPAALDSTPVQGEVPANAQTRTEAEPLPVMDDATGIDTEQDLDTAAPTPEPPAENAQ